MELWYLYILLGIVAGVVSVTLGIGSGIIMVPALTLLFALVPESARGVALCVMVPMAMMGAARHVLDKDIQIDLTIVLLVAVGAIAGAFFGFYIAKHVTSATLKKVFAVFMLIVAVYMLWSPSKSKTVSTEPPPSGAISDPGSPRT